MLVRLTLAIMTAALLVTKYRLLKDYTATARAIGSGGATRKRSAARNAGHSKPLLLHNGQLRLGAWLQFLKRPVYAFYFGKN